MSTTILILPFFRQNIILVKVKTIVEINNKERTIVDQPKTTVAGTNIEEVKRLNAQSGLTYNEVKALLAKQKRTAKK